MNFKKIVAPVAVSVAALFGASSAQAAFILEIVGSTTTTIVDNGAGDAAGTAGAIAWLGFIDGYAISFASGTYADDPFNIHMTASVSGNGNAQNALTFRLTKTDIVAPAGLTTVNGGGSAYGIVPGGSYSWASYIDASNAQFGTGTLLASGAGFGSYTGAATLDLSPQYSATLISSFDFRNTSKTSMYTASTDFGANVPEPTSIALVGLALLGAGALSRRRSS